MSSLFRRVSLLFVAAAMLLSGPAFADEATKKSLQEMYTSFLKAEGYIGKIDKDGDVTFKREGKNYFIRVNDDDSKFFRLVFPAFWKIEDPAENLRALAAAEESNRKSKVSKVFLVNGNTWASIELFVDKPEDFKKIFSRSLSALQNGVANYVKAMRASKKGEGKATK